MASSVAQVGHALASQLMQIPSTASHHEALRTLFGSLSKNQRRHLHEWFKEEELRYDILDNLPLEVCLQIIRHLSLRDSIQTRRVSRQWMQVLSAEVTTKAIFRLHYPYGKPSTHLPATLSQREASSAMAEHIEAFHTGAAFYLLTWSESLSKSSLIYSLVAYSSGVVSWISNNGYSVRLLQLATGKCHRLDCDGQDLFCSTAACSSIHVAITINGLNFLIDSNGNVMSTLRLSSGRTLSVAVASDVVAILHNSSLLDTSPTEIITRALQGREGSRFAVNLRQNPSKNFCFEQKLMISDTGNSIVLLERTYSPETVSFARLGLDGQVLAKGSLEVPDAMTSGRLSSPGDPAMDADGWATIWSYSGSSILQLQHHPIEDKLRRLAQSGQNYSRGLYRGQGVSSATALHISGLVINMNKNCMRPISRIPLQPMPQWERRPGGETYT